MARAMVLVIESDTAIREMLRAALESAGYSVVVAAGDGAAWAVRERPDLILVDMSAASSEGIPPSVRLRVQAARIPIIAMTTVATPSLREPAAVDAWLTKPFHLAELYAAVEHWTGQRARSA